MGFRDTEFCGQIRDLYRIRDGEREKQRIGERQEAKKFRGGEAEIPSSLWDFGTLNSVDTSEIRTEFVTEKGRNGASENDEKLGS